MTIIYKDDNDNARTFERNKLTEKQGKEESGDVLVAMGFDYYFSLSYKELIHNCYVY